MTQKYKKKH